MVFTGSVANINAALNNLTYRGLTYFFGNDTITISAFDPSGAFTTTQTFTVVVHPTAAGTMTSIGSAGSENTGTSLSVSLTSSVPAGGTVLLGVAFDYTYTGTVTITDSRGNVYTSNADKTESFAPFAGVRGVLFVAPVTTSLSVGDMVTVHFTSNVVLCAIEASAVSGIITPFDQATTAGGVGGTESTGTTAATTQANESWSWASLQRTTRPRRRPIRRRQGSAARPPERRLLRTIVYCSSPARSLPLARTS